MTKLEAFFTPKKVLIDTIEDLSCKVDVFKELYEGNKTICLELKDENEFLKQELLVLKETIKGLMANYEEVIKELRNFCELEDFDPKKENEAKKERTSMSEAINDLLDWGD